MSRRRTWRSSSKPCSEVAPRKMVASKVPLCNNLHNMLSNMVSAEQSKKEGSAAGSMGKSRVMVRRWKRWCSLSRCTRAACWDVAWCGGKPCCCKCDLLLQQRIAPQQARNAAGSARAARRGVEQAARRLVYVREAAAHCGCRSRRCGRVCADGWTRLHRAKK